MIFKGVVEKKDSIAKTIRSGNPVKYFELTVSIESPDLSVVQPGNKVTAKIIGDSKQDILIVPLQVIFNDDDGSYVYVEDNGKMRKQSVTLGLKTFAEIEIKSGLTVNEQVALFQPIAM
jgi:hypothetical protein